MVYAMPVTSYSATRHTHLWQTFDEQVGHGVGVIQMLKKMFAIDCLTGLVVEWQRFTQIESEIGGGFHIDIDPALLNYIRAADIDRKSAASTVLTSEAPPAAVAFADAKLFDELIRGLSDAGGKRGDETCHQHTA